MREESRPAKEIARSGHSRRPIAFLRRSETQPEKKIGHRAIPATKFSHFKPAMPQKQAWMCRLNASTNARLKTMANTVTIPTATGHLAAFLTEELLPSIPAVSGSGSSANHDEQHNQYVLPTASQLASWRVVFQSLLAGAWGTAHDQARTISSTYNVIEFRDTDRIYYVLMEGVPDEIPDPADHPSGSVTITDPADPTRRGLGYLCLRCAASAGPEPLGAAPFR